MRPPLLECKNVEFCEEDGTCLFQEVTFRLEAGQRGVMLAEPHRCATFLLKICATLLPPSGGDVSWFGRSKEQMKKREFYQLRRQIGYVHRETSLISNMTILDNISLGLQYHEEVVREQAYKDITELLEQFELYEAVPDKEAEKREIIFFKHGANVNEGINLMFLVDNSGSMYTNMYGQETTNESAWRISYRPRRAKGQQILPPV